MKRLIFITVTLLLMNAASHAQTFSGGITAGLVASQLSGDKSAGYNKLGFYGGPYANFHLADRTRFQMEIIYIQKGSRQVPSEDNGYYSYKSRLNYVEVPLMIRYEYKERFELEAGIAYSFLISSYEELYDQKIDGEPFHTHNSSLIVGLYYVIDDRWCVNFRTSNSITPVRPHKSGQIEWRRLNFGQTNNLLSLGMFYKL